jgi:hypothetical protein
MGTTRFAGFLLVGLIVLACGPRVAPTAQTSSASSPARTQLPESTPTPTSSPTQDGITASVTCVGGPGAAMTVIAGAFVYEVADPLHPRLVCRSANTVLHLLDSNAIAYTAVVDGHVVIVRRDLTTGAESRLAQLRADPHPYYYGGVGWTWDGSLEVYSTSGVPRADGRSLVSVHLWSSGADHVLFRIDAGPGGLESRWSPRGILAFSPDHLYLAISDFPFYIYGENVRIFSVADQGQKFVTAMSSSGGTWIGNDRFLWATMASSGSLMQWTPSGGAKLLRSETWWGPASSSDGRWMAGTLVTDVSNPRVVTAPVSGGAALTTGPGSSPRFVTPTLVWYAEEGPDTSGSYQCVEPCSHPTTPDGTVRAFDVTNGADRVVSFSVGEAPKTDEGYTICCLTSG